MGKYELIDNAKVGDILTLTATLKSGWIWCFKITKATEKSVWLAQLLDNSGRLDKPFQRRRTSLVDYVPATEEHLKVVEEWAKMRKENGMDK